MVKMEIEKEIDEIKIRLDKIEKHVNKCDEHEGAEGHGKKGGDVHQEHGKKH